MKVEIRTKILEMYAHLSAKQKLVADYILEHSADISTMTMKELATACLVAEPTVVRFLNSLGYESFLAFRVDLAREVNTQEVENFGDGYREITLQDSTENIMKKTTEAISFCLQKTEDTLDQSRIDKVTELMLNAKGIIFYGAGNSSAIAMDASYRLFRIGLNSIFSENFHVTLTMISRLNQNDVVVLISHSGESMDMLECAKAARERGTIVVGITGNIDSPLSKLADYVLFTYSQDMSSYTDAMASRIAQMMILDIIYIKIRLSRGEEAMGHVQEARETISKVKTRINKG